MSDLNYDKEHCCCFFGHRKIEETSELRNKVYIVIEELIKDYEVYTFFFGSKSEFDDICFNIVSELKEKYSHNVRANKCVNKEWSDELNKDYIRRVKNNR